MYIQSDRLEFRSYTDEDFHFLWSLLADSEVVRYIGKGQTRDRSEALEFLYWIYRSYKENPQGGLRLLIRKEDGRRIGHAGLVYQNIEGIDELEVGYWIAKEFWGQGYAKEAAVALRDYGLHQLDRQRLISLIQPGNKASQKVAQHIGMSVEKEIVLSGKNVCVYAIEKEESDGFSDF
ncbi:GNAT family N-acetyltransferase [Planococcus sp. CPCC 101016]|uniref:GNAT family N-acetyltransferase n=1 Tax=Planococcus sp. CPCC 101016 TaxID=2599617 RepID=UPI0011B3C18F|nr:GNAT family N-acetyltransferase [Planococcus sp. CPCC 101016]TWT06367.1 GNAT family N-acetyltransferase [Planococcus sp. CPCC 101016]